jgi:two-component system, cell cycle response regulator
VIAVSEKNKPKPQIKEKPYQQPKHAKTATPGADASVKPKVNSKPEQPLAPPEQPKQAKPQPPKVEAPKIQQTQAESSPGQPTISLSALIVEDNHSFQKLLAMSLSMNPKIGTIDFADSGESAIKKAKMKVYDIIFMDAMMPGIDGYITCGIIRKNKEYKQTPIIMVTGLDSPMDEAKAILAGTSSYVTKPIQQLPFKELIDREIALLEYKKTKDNPT